MRTATRANLLNAETTAINALSTFVHHGMIFVPLGYKNTFGQLTNLTEVHGGECPSHFCSHAISPGIS